MIQMIDNENLITYEVIVNEKVEVICKMHCELHHLPYDPDHSENEYINQFGQISHYFRTGNIKDLYRYYFVLLPKLNSPLYEEELEILKKYMNGIFDIKVIKIEPIKEILAKNKETIELAYFMLDEATRMTVSYQSCKYLPLVKDEDRPRLKKQLLKNMI